MTRPHLGTSHSHQCSPPATRWHTSSFQACNFNDLKQSPTPRNLRKIEQEVSIGFDSLHQELHACIQMSTTNSHDLLDLFDLHMRGAPPHWRPLNMCRLRLLPTCPGVLDVSRIAQVPTCAQVKDQNWWENKRNSKIRDENQRLSAECNWSNFHLALILTATSVRSGHVRPRHPQSLSEAAEPQLPSELRPAQAHSLLTLL